MSIEQKANDELDFIRLAKSYGPEVAFDHLVRFDSLDMRVGIVSIHFVNIIGVNDGFVEFCPNSSPPTNDELLAWLWLIRPDLSEQVAKYLKNRTFRDSILKSNHESTSASTKLK